jgi:hypothetical protein
VSREETKYIADLSTHTYESPQHRCSESLADKQLDDKALEEKSWDSSVSVNSEDAAFDNWLESSAAAVPSLKNYSMSL